MLCSVGSFKGTTLKELHAYQLQLAMVNFVNVQERKSLSGYVWPQKL